MSLTVEQAIKQAVIRADDARYRMIHLPARAITVAAGILAHVGEPFAALIVDRAEVTLVIDAELVPDFEDRLRDHRISDAEYSLITFDLPLEPTLTGFMARISAALAQVGIPIMPYAAFERDHLLVPADQRDHAIAVLQALQEAITP